MKDLRVLTMSHNLIMRLDPNVRIVEGGNIPIVDFSDNHNMDFLDISNMFRPGPFCTLNFTNSYIEHITNELGFVLEEVIHGPGDILLEHTHIGSFINFISIGLEDLAELGKYFEGQMNIDASSINCDCTVFPILDSMGPEIAKYWRNVDKETFVCQSPESMKGKNLTDIIETGNFEKLTCDLSEKPDCPRYYCHCIDMPSEHKVLVNCTGAGLTSMPEEMPVGAWNNYKIDLILADIKITVLHERNYYSRLVSLDLRQNNVTFFTEKAAGNISSKLNIESQILVKLPYTLHHKSPNLITFGPHPIVCDCSNTWIGEWIRLKHGHGRLNCSVNGEVVPAEDVSELTLNCNKYTLLPSAAIVSSAIGGITLFVVITGLCFLFRYEIMIMKRTLFRKEFTEGLHNIDVFLSFSEDNDDVFVW
ncbi:uncharacterized protein LOC128556777 [Mercenaria mercenaria]|uniref:uncharacterized protein LOC128556777 n=1 Tax=Mercenaria mercenaria TaxID=6596 RepID=UPI00234F6418|nr:uncharacterized protein LOC128556777 [Mercenaria mercenaria]